MGRRRMRKMERMGTMTTREEWGVCKRLQTCREQRRKGKRLNPGIRGKGKGRNSTKTGRRQKRKGRRKSKEKRRREKTRRKTLRNRKKRRGTGTAGTRRRTG